MVGIDRHPGLGGAAGGAYKGAGPGDRVEYVPGNGPGVAPHADRHHHAVPQVLIQKTGRQPHHVVPLPAAFGVVHGNQGMGQSETLLEFVFQDQVDGRVRTYVDLHHTFIAGPF